MKYDPEIYGSLRARFLEDLDRLNFSLNLDTEEQMRKKLIEDIKAGKLKIQK